MTTRSPAEGSLCISFDIDWAPDELVEPVVEMLLESGVRATFFATHQSSLLKQLDNDRFEIGLHPNFSGADNLNGALQTLADMYPEAKGARSHSLSVSGAILQTYVDSGLKYESNAHLPFHEGLHPVKRMKELVSIPIYWEDDTNFLLGLPYDLDNLRLDEPGLKVLSFHPIHVFMNTFSEAHYTSYKKYYQDPQQLRAFINKRDPGVGTLFKTLLDYIATSGRPTYTLQDVYERYVTASNGL